MTALEYAFIVVFLGMWSLVGTLYVYVFYLIFKTAAKMDKERKEREQDVS